MLFYVLYLSLFSILCLMVSYLKRRKIEIEIFNYIPLYIVLFVSVFRFDVGYDYPSYYDSILHPDSLSINRYDYLSTLFAEISICFKSPFLFFFLYAISTYFLIFYACCKCSVSPLFSFYIYFCVYYLDSLGIIRQALAIAIVFYGYDYIRRRLVFKYMILVILASLFHKTALISLFLYPIYRMKFKFLLVIVFFFLAFENNIHNLLIEYEIMKFYFITDMEFAGGNKIMICNIILYLVLLFVSKCNNSYEKTKGLFKLIFLGLLFPFIFGGALGGRLSLYFLIFNILLVPYVLNKSNLYLKTYFVSYFVIYYIVSLYISQFSGRSGLIPYQFIFHVDEAFPVFRWRSPFVF